MHHHTSSIDGFWNLHESSLLFDPLQVTSVCTTPHNHWYFLHVSTDDPLDKPIPTDEQVYTFWSLGTINNVGLVAHHHHSAAGKYIASKVNVETFKCDIIVSIIKCGYINHCNFFYYLLVSIFLTRSLMDSKSDEIFTWVIQIIVNNHSTVDPNLMNIQSLLRV